MRSSNLRWRLRRRPGGVFLFALALGVYLLTGTYLELAGNLIEVDALARVANADYVLFSRDPHLAAIGFVWSPLPSLVQIPLLPAFHFLLPDLLARGLPGTLMSAVFMAGTVYQMHETLRDMHLNRAAALAITVLFAVDPLILYFGANGMSEAPMLFFLTVAARQFGNWLSVPDSSSIVKTALALAVAYLCRYETSLAAAGVVIIAACATFLRSDGTPRSRLVKALCDAIVVAVPFVMTFLIWTGATWVIMGSPFARFLPSTTNTTPVHTAVLALNNAATNIHTAGDRMLWEAPILPAVMIVAILATLVRRQLWAVAILTIFGGTLSFTVLALLLGQADPSPRYFIVVIPAAYLLFGTGMRALAEWTRSRPAPRLASRVAPVVSAALLIAPALPHTAGGLADIVQAGVGVKKPVEMNAFGFQTHREIAQYLDGLGLPRESVLMDTNNGFPIFLSSRRPEQFVVTSDRDFPMVLADPRSAHVRYFLVPDPNRKLGFGSLDPLNRQYPGIYDTGAGLGRIVREFHSSDGLPGWRLYQLE